MNKLYLIAEISNTLANGVYMLATTLSLLILFGIPFAHQNNIITDRWDPSWAFPSLKTILQLINCISLHFIKDANTAAIWSLVIL